MPRRTKSPLIIIAIAYALAIVVLSVAGLMPWGVVAWIVFCSLATYAIYYWDKQAAINGGYRTREYSLHLWALLGGWIGATIAQRQFRHKTQKEEFQTIFVLTIIAHIAFVAYLFVIEPYF